MWWVCDYFADIPHLILVRAMMKNNGIGECDYYEMECDYYVIILECAECSSSSGFRECCISGY